MKKKMIALFIVLTLSFCLFADDIRTFFPSLKKTPVFPVDSDLNQCVDSDVSEDHVILSEALSESFSFEWAEKYLHKNYKKNIVSIYSALLSELLPGKSLLFSKARINSDKSSVITVKFVETGKVISFAVKDNAICAILD